MNISEKRWREGSGVQFMKDDKTVRCQSRSKTKLKAKRKEIREDMAGKGIPEEEIEEWIKENTYGEDWGWPECQCQNKEVAGTFLCGFHGGESYNITTRDITDMAPIDIKKTMDILRSDPDYISQKREIDLVRSRLWNLLGRLDKDGISDSSAYDIMDAIDKMRDNNIVEAISILEVIADERVQELRIYAEVRELASLLTNMTKNEVTNVKNMRQIVTEDQVSNMLDNIFRLYDTAHELYIDDPAVARKVREYVERELREYINATAISVRG